MTPYQKPPDIIPGLEAYDPNKNWVDEVKRMIALEVASAVPREIASKGQVWESRVRGVEQAQKFTAEKVSKQQKAIEDLREDLLYLRNALDILEKKLRKPKEPKPKIATAVELPPEAVAVLFPAAPVGKAKKKPGWWWLR